MSERQQQNSAGFHLFLMLEGEDICGENVKRGLHTKKIIERIS